MISIFHPVGYWLEISGSFLWASHIRYARGGIHWGFGPVSGVSGVSIWNLMNIGLWRFTVCDEGVLNGMIHRSFRIMSRMVGSIRMVTCYPWEQCFLVQIQYPSIPTHFPWKFYGWLRKQNQSMTGRAGIDSIWFGGNMVGTPWRVCWMVMIGYWKWGDSIFCYWF